MEETVDMVDKNLQGLSLVAGGGGPPQLVDNDAELGATLTQSSVLDITGGVASVVIEGQQETQQMQLCDDQEELGVTMSTSSASGCDINTSYRAVLVATVKGQQENQQLEKIDNDLEWGTVKTGGWKDSGAELGGNGLECHPEMKRLGAGGAVLYHFTQDLEAQSKDPKVLETHYQFPLKYWIRQDGVLTGGHPDPWDKLVISQSFMNMLASSNVKVHESLKALEQFKGVPGSMRRFKEVVPLFKSRRYQNEFHDMKKLKVIQKPKLKAKDRMKDKKGAKKEKAKVETNSQTQDDPLNQQVVSKRFKLAVYYRDIQTLPFPEYLNDVIIDFGMARVFQTPDLFPEGTVLLVSNLWKLYFFKRADSHVMPTTARRMLKTCTEGVPDGNLMKLKYLVLPIGRETHWLLAIIINPFPDENTVQKYERKAMERGVSLKTYSGELYHEWLFNRDLSKRPNVAIMDSMVEMAKNKSNANLNGFHQDSVKYIKLGLLRLHKAYWQSTGREIELDNDTKASITIPWTRMDMPGQQNGSDCGLYSMNYALAWFSRLKHYDGRFMELLNDPSDIKPYWYRYETVWNRKRLFDELFEDCQRDNPGLLPQLEQLRAPRRAIR